MGFSPLRYFFMALSSSSWVEKVFQRFPPARRVARRFIAGETLEEALSVAKKLNDEGKEVTLNFLGEGGTTREETRRVVEDYARILEQVHEQKLKATISVKPTHLGLKLGAALYGENLERLLETSDRLGLSLEVDMEDSGTTEETLQFIYSNTQEKRCLRVALQAYLHRTAKDLNALVERGGSARLVKGAYDEPEDVAWRMKSEVDESYGRLIEASLSPNAMASGFYPAFGTHDHRLIDRIIAFAEKHNIPKDRFELQMLLGIRNPLQDKLVEQGCKVRVYVPFGSQWYPYFMRRLAERPANVLFMLRALLTP